VNNVDVDIQYYRQHEYGTTCKDDSYTFPLSFLKSATGYGNPSSVAELL
jgi:hypothetical protein